MGTTPIYGFPYPDPSDLVANYPAMGQELAEDIEAVLPTLGGLIPLASASPAASSSTIFDNLFSATYRQYIVAWTLVASATGDFNFRLRSGSPAADDTSNNYTSQLLQANNTTLTGQKATATSGRIGSLRTNATGSLIVISNPNAALVTSMGTTSYADYAAGIVSDTLLRIDAMVMNTTTQYTGITFTPSTGNYTGRINIFGVKL
jgi:hypothetical protein